MVPSEWKQTTLDKVLTIGGGKDYKHLEKGSIPVYGSGGYMLSVSDYLYDGESVCIGRKGTIDKPMFLRGKFWTVDTLFYTHSFKDSVPYFIYQFFQTVPWRSLSEASGVPSLSKSVINKVKINLPPLPEQRKIAKILFTWDKAISSTERLIDNSKQQKKALMQQLITGKKRLLDDSGKPFKGEWEVVTFDDALAKLTDYTANGSFASLAENVKVYDDENYSLWIMGRTLKSGNYLKDVRYTDEKGYEFLKKTKLFGGELLMPKTGDVGMAYLLPKLDKKATLADNVFLLDFKQFVLNTYARYFINSEHFQFQLERMMYGTSQKTIVKKVLRKMNILIPSSIEQQKIVKVLELADKEINVLEQQLADLKQEKKALMQQLLTGKRRVKVDDEAVA